MAEVEPDPADAGGEVKDDLGAGQGVAGRLGGAQVVLGAAHRTHIGAEFAQLLDEDATKESVASRHGDGGPAPGARIGAGVLVSVGRA